MWNPLQACVEVAGCLLGLLLLVLTFLAEETPNSVAFNSLTLSTTGTAGSATLKPSWPSSCPCYTDADSAAVRLQDSKQT